jgi:hypothetical protein
MKKLLLFLSIITATFLANAQSSAGKALRKTITLTMPRTVDDEMPGTRGASVVWHPLQKKYYAAMAGNVSYPLGVYDATGKRLSDDSLNCGEDVRGLWYNPQKKQIQGNSYNDYGWFSYSLDAKGLPASTDIFMGGMNQPDEQAVGTYSFTRQEVLFLYSGHISLYKIADGTTDDEELEIHWGRTKQDGAGEPSGTPENYNSSTVVYTGIKGRELGFLNIIDMQIELYDITDGFMTNKLQLPEDAPMNATFNFAYTNGMYWLFNIETRTWTGYK